jgi:hypothetical protein
MAGLLYITLICLVVLMITLVEGVVLTLLKWAGFGQSLVSALPANIVSTLVIGLLLILVKQPRYSNLIVGWAISSLVETIILYFFRRQPLWRTFMSATLANLASYIILILPAFYYGQSG